MQHAIGARGEMSLKIIRNTIKGWTPKTDLGRLVRTCYDFLPRELADELLDKIMSCVVVESELSLVVIHGPNAYEPGRIDDYGVVRRKVITTAGVNALATNFQAASAVANYNFHGIGTGTNPEAITDTALQTEVPNGTYASSGVRPTGTKTNPSANVYQTVGSNVVAANATVQEMGMFSQAATGGGTLWDRFLTGTQTLLTGDTLQTTCKATFTAGG